MNASEKRRKERKERQKAEKLSQPERVKKQRADAGLREGGGGIEYQIGDKKLSKENYQAVKSGLGFTGSPGKATPETEEIVRQMMPLSVKEQIEKGPSEFGLGIPGQEAEKPDSMEIIKEEIVQGKEDRASGILGFVPGKAGEILGKSEITTKEFIEDPKIRKELIKRGAFASIVFGVGAWAASGFGYKIGSTIVANPKKAVQLGTAAKNSIAAKTIGQKIFNYGVGGYALLKGTEGVAGYFTGRKIDEQQQAVNTLGQMATTIAGDSTEARGDWRLGLQELDYLESQVLYLEGAIKAGQISSAVVRYNGKIYDINADMADQLATIAEQKTIIQSFVLTESFPELSELEIQGILRELEEEGIIEGVDFTTSRRQIK